MDEFAPNGRPRPAGLFHFEPLEDRSLPSSLTSLLAEYRPPPGFETAWAALVANAPAFVAEYNRIHSNPVFAAADARTDAMRLAAGTAREVIWLGPVGSFFAWAERTVEAVIADRERSEPSLSLDRHERVPRNLSIPTAAPAPAVGSPSGPDSAATGPTQPLAAVAAGQSPESPRGPVTEAGEADCDRRPGPVAPGVRSAPDERRQPPAQGIPPDDRLALEQSALLAAAKVEGAGAHSEDVAIPLLGGVSVDVGAIERGAGELLSLLGQLVEDCGEWLPAVTNLGCVAMSAAVAAELARLWRRQAAHGNDELPPDPLLPVPEGTA